MGDRAKTGLKPNGTNFSRQEGLDHEAVKKDEGTKHEDAKMLAVLAAFVSSRFAFFAPFRAFVVQTSQES